MTIGDDYRVVTTGRILEGFDPEGVKKHLVSILRLQPAQAEVFFEKPRVLKKGMSWASADKLCGQLAKLGVAAEIKEPAPVPAEPKPALQEEPALALVEDKDESGPAEDTIECPNCQHVQAKSEQCENCGIWFHKFGLSEPPQPTQPAVTPDATPASTAQANESTVSSSDVASGEGALSPAAIAAAAVAALIGALIWKFIAVTFDYELGLIAWAIGGAVGVAAASAGSRGVLAGVLCAVLAFGSIVIGKYWAYSAFVDQFQETIVSELEADDELYGYYEEELADAEAFVSGSGSDIFVRRFMVERNYTYADNPADVTDEEFAEFREYSEPKLREIAANPPTFEEWQGRTAEVFDDISPWSLMLMSFGLLDVVFIFLGVGTAFRLGSQRD